MKEDRADWVIHLCPHQSPLLQDSVNIVMLSGNLIIRWIIELFMIMSCVFMTMEMCLSLLCKIYYQEYSKVLDGE